MTTAMGEAGEMRTQKASQHSASGAGTPHKEFFTIGDLAREFDLTLRSLRFYEDKGLLNPRRQGQTRLFSRRDRARLKLVLMGKKVGFSLSEIREMLDLYDLKDGRTTQLKVALEKFCEQIRVLEEQRSHIDQAIADLSRTRDIVAGMLKAREEEGDG